jgi:hypothetical protein
VIFNSPFNLVLLVTAAKGIKTTEEDHVGTIRRRVILPLLITVYRKVRVVKADSLRQVMLIDYRSSWLDSER